MKMQSSRVLVCVIGFCCIGTSNCSAEVHELWTLERLYKESDCIVVVSLTASEDSKKLIDHPRLKEKLRLISTKLNVVQSFKGSLKNGDEVVLEHWLPQKGNRSDGLNQPIVWQKSKEFEMGGGAFVVQLNYLIFLRKTTKGMEFTSGMWDGIDSVRELLTPSSVKE